MVPGRWPQAVVVPVEDHHLTVTALSTFCESRFRVPSLGLDRGAADRRGVTSGYVRHR
jgi:hypothetical protein